MKVSRGDVVLLDFPFSDATGSKVRPAVVVQSDAHNRRLTSTLVVLTKTTHRARRVDSQLLIEVNTPAGKAAGLHFDSAVACTNLYTVHQNFINYRIGRLANELLPELDDCLRSALGIG